MEVSEKYDTRHRIKDVGGLLKVDFFEFEEILRFFSFKMWKCFDKTVIPKGTSVHFHGPLLW